MKQPILLFLLLPLCLSAQINNYKQDSITLSTAAFGTLQKQMPTADFQQLDWQNIRVDTLSKLYQDWFNKAMMEKYNAKKQVAESILIVPFKNDSSQLFLYTEQQGKKYFNRVKLDLRPESVYLSGTISTYSVQNKLMKSWVIKHDKTVVSTTPDSLLFGSRKVAAPTPKIIFRVVLDTVNKKSIFFYSAYYLLFNETIDDKNIFSPCYFTRDYNVILFDFLMGHMSSKYSKNFPVKVQTIYKRY